MKKAGLGGGVPGDPVERFLGALARRLVRESLLRSGLWSLSGAFLGLTVAMVVGWSPLLPALATGLAAGLLSGGWALLRGVSPAVAAREAEGRFPLPPRESHLLTTLAEMAGGEGEVAHAFRRRGALLAERLTPEQLLPLRWKAEASVVAATAGMLLVTSLAVGRMDSPAMGSPGTAGAERTASLQATPAGSDSGEPQGEGSVRARVIPPSYTGLPEWEELDPESLFLIPGTRVEFTPTSGSAVRTVRVLTQDGEGSGTSVGAGDGRALDWTMGEVPVVLLLEGPGPDGNDGVPLRLIPASPDPDPPPVVTLESPNRDLVLASPSGRIQVAARAVDPFGVDSLTLVWTRTRGGGESFAFQDGVLEGVTVTRRHRGELTGAVELDLAELDLRPGDLLHLRAVAVDGNRVTGPGRGASPVRILRVARSEEDPEINTLIGFPLEAEREPVLSQRMIILLTEDLRERAPGLSRSQVTREALEIAREQARLRAEVGEQVFSRATGAMREPGRFLGDDHDHDIMGDLPAWVRGEAAGGQDDHDHGDVHEEEELDFDYLRGFSDDLSGAAGIMEVDLEGHDHDGDPILSVNEGLLAAFNAMWEAERELRQSDVDLSLPHQYEALEELQAMRTAVRVFPRGEVSAPPVDVAATRGTGPRTGIDPAPRVPGPVVEGVREREGELDLLARRLPELEPVEGGRALAVLAARLLPLGEMGARASVHLSRAVTLLRLEGVGGALDEVESARALLAPRNPVAGGFPTSLPWNGGEARLLGGGQAESGVRGPRGAPTRATPGRPLVFATGRYRSGNWDSAPLVPTNLHHTVARYTDIPVPDEGVVVDLASPDLLRHPFVFLTGHLPVRFTPEESENLKRYVESGGFLFIDDHNHDIDGAFHLSVVDELGRLFGPDALEPLPREHPLYHAFFRFPDGPPVTSHELSGWGDGLIHPDLFGIHHDGRLAVLYSNKDYASEWNYHAVNKRFLAVDNTRFGMNVLLYALTR